MKAEKPRGEEADIAYVRCVANAILKETPGDNRWEIAVFDDDAVNAFALPGGKIGVYTGLLDLAENQHQVAAVIGHEVAHVIARHHAARVSSQLATQLGVSVAAGSTGVDPRVISMGADLLLTLPHSRRDEAEADQLGLQYMARAGFDPRQSTELWQTMARQGGGRPPELLSTHPSPSSRIQDLRNLMPRVMPLYEQAGNRPQCR